jgi:hypothetical protein
MHLITFDGEPVVVRWPIDEVGLGFFV